ncbi:MAG TPA: FAD-dependent oxidoreductase [Acidimicrobiales bacterium]
MQIAIVGTGISGLLCAHLLDPHHEVTVFEAGDRVGGHTNTLDIELPGADGTTEHHAVDTGFIVFNDRNYPGFVKLLDRLGVASRPSDMSFSVSNERSGLEYRASNLNTLYAQRSNLLRPSFTRMLVDIVRFDRAARQLVVSDADESVSLEELVSRGGYSQRFRDEFLVPFGASIWSADPETFLQFPAVAYCRFMDNHGLLQLRGMPTWRTVEGGSRQYVRALTARLRRPVRTNTAVTKVVRRLDPGRPLGGVIEVATDAGSPETFDAIVLAGHSDQSLEVLGDPSSAERSILGAIRYQPNLATLHTDARLLPRRTRARASWNYHLGSGSGREATLTYWMNALQGLQSRHDILVTLNRPGEIDHRKVIADIEYDHPVFDADALGAQRRRTEIQGRRGTFFAGAYWGYGFHEDGVRSALDVCRHFGVDL